MSTPDQKKKLISRVRRIRGQLEAVERALEDERGCAAVLQTATSARGALNGLVGEVIELHIRNHVVDPAATEDPARDAAVEDLIRVIRAYVK